MFVFTTRVSALYCLFLSLSLALCQQAGDIADPAAVVPFFVRNDEGGGLVVIVVYGPNVYEKISVYCRDNSERDLITQGPGVMQCIKTGADEYDLVLPFQFVRNNSGAITGVSYEDPEGIVVSFRTETNGEGKVIAKSFYRSEDDSSTDAEYRIPYTIERSDDGDFVAIVFVEDEQLTVPLRYITSSDGSSVIGVSFVPNDERNPGPAIDAGILGIVIFIGVLACVGLFLTNRKRREYGNDNKRRRRQSRDALKNGSVATTDPDEVETVICDLQSKPSEIS